MSSTGDRDLEPRGGDGADSDQPALEVSALRKAYGDTVALSDVDLTVDHGEFVTVVGPSGCGKSTLLRVLTGLEERFEGRAEIDGSDVREGGSDDVGMVFQEPRLLPWATVRENVAVGLDGPDDGRVDDLVSQVGLEGFGDTRPDELSGGMAQRVSLARGLAYEPELLLLDEPFSALDALTKYEQQDFLLEVWNRLEPTVLLVTHDVEEAAYLGDRVVVLGDQPGTVERVIDVAVDRPRERTADGLVPVRESITDALGV
ncbi:ABC transporter ATP-binding protein [Halobiforma nitratireducens]|uniref:Nitrate/sulfonate/bicarbonate ABC transporter ATPase n=1 Tax=Halobiforma nitratireducens JCM 10879 TaxID=1227454 RepID=M0M0I7_9EURY|nr:ABC transporter ATP-binding protein [Halobiforma nitratireducens]EMA38933.1 nitrate/sulfonate/bicarbonate ABC transporter ATPase [Halobiforma nitratireducens JCM 10879]